MPVWEWFPDIRGWVQIQISGKLWDDDVASDGHDLLTRSDYLALQYLFSMFGENCFRGQLFLYTDLSTDSKIAPFSAYPRSQPLSCL